MKTNLDEMIDYLSGRADPETTARVRSELDNAHSHANTFLNGARAMGERLIDRGFSIERAAAAGVPGPTNFWVTPLQWCVLRVRVSRQARRTARALDRGDYRKALANAKQTVDLATQLYGPDDCRMGHVLIVLGHNYTLLGDYYSAEPVLREAARLIRNVAVTPIGVVDRPWYASLRVVERPWYAASLHALGRLYREMGELELALQLIERALTQFTAPRGTIALGGHKSRRIVLECKHDLATVFYKMGKFSQAEGLLRETIETAGRHLPQRDLFHVAAVANLGILLYSQGKFAEAETLLRQAVDRCERFSQAEHPLCAQCLTHLGSLLALRGNTEEAEVAITQAIHIQSSLLGQGHNSFADSLSALGDLYGSINKSAEAVDAHRKAIVILSDTLGENHPKYNVAVCGLAAALSHLGEHAESKELYQRAITNIRLALGVRNPLYVMTLNNYALALSSAGDYAEAQRSAEEALSISTDLYGEDHLYVALAQANLGVIFQEVGDIDKADSVFRRAFNTLRTVIGEEHPLVSTLPHGELSFYVQTPAGPFRMLFRLPSAA